MDVAATGAPTNPFTLSVLMHIDPTITYGTLIHLIALIIGGIGGWLSIIRRLDKFEYQNALMWREFLKLHKLNGEPTGA